MKNLIYITLFLLPSLFSWAQTPRQVLDLSPGATSTFTNEDDRILGVVTESKILFQVYYTEGRKEIWVSDGRAGGTQKLLDLGAAFLQKAIPYQQDMLLILDRGSKSEIWQSDGTVAGTRLLYETPQILFFPLIWKDVLYYASNNNTFLGNTNALFALPLAGPQYLAQNLYGFEDRYGISQLMATTDRLIGVGSVVGQGQNLFSSDGTKAGTKIYHQLNPGIPANLSDPIYATTLGKQVFFFYETSFNGLYVTDGTAAGTRLLGRYKDQRFGKRYQQRRAFFAWEGKFYFSADSLSNNTSSSETLHVSDGTLAGTHHIKFGDIGFTEPEWFLPYQNKLYFKAYSEFGLEYVCVLEPNKTSAQIAIDHFQLGEGSSFGGDYLCQFQDSIFFSAWRREVGLELWKSKGSTASTQKWDLVKGRDNGWPEQLTVAGNKLFFTGTQTGQGRELWVYDPSGSLVSTSHTPLLQAKLELRPNPAVENLQLQIESETLLKKVVIYDVLGRAVFQQILSGKSFSTLIQVSTWPKGLYLLELQGENGAKKVQKFMTK